MAGTIDQVRVVDESDKYEDDKAFIFIIVYTMGTWPSKERLGFEVKPGYVILFKADTLKWSTNTQGQPCYEYEKREGEGRWEGQLHGKAWSHFIDRR